MLDLTKEQREYLNHHNAPLSSVFDASGLKKKEYQDLMEGLDKYIAIGVTPCKLGGHTMRSRAGHCLQCKPESFAYYNRYYKDAYVYVAVSKIKKIIKVGYTIDVKIREATLITTSYAGISDWEIIYSVKCKNAGRIESEIHKKLHEYFLPGEYLKEGRLVACYELFSCSYNKIKQVIQDVKFENAASEFTLEYEQNDAELLYKFPDIKKQVNVIRKGNQIETQSKVLPVTLLSKKAIAPQNSNFTNDLSETKQIITKIINDEIPVNSNKSRLSLPKLITGCVVILLILYFLFK